MSKTNKSNKKSKELDYSKYPLSLHIINDISSIEQLAPFYDLLLNHTKYIIKEDEPEDLLHNAIIKLDTYLKKYPGKTINGGFIKLTISNLQKNKWSTENTESKYINHQISELMTDSDLEEDNVRYMEDKNDSEDVIRYKKENESFYIEIENRLSQLTYVERTVLEYSLIMNMSEMSRVSGIPLGSLNLWLRRAKSKVGVIGKIPYSHPQHQELNY